MLHRPNFSIACLAFLSISVAHSAELDWSEVDQAMSKKGAEQPGGVHKYSFPRTDLKITVDDVEIKPAFALGSWVAFLPMEGGAMAMGDLVLTDREISPVMKHLIDGGFTVSAIHNHLLRMSSNVVYMHIGAHGDPTKLAQILHSALALSKTPLGQVAPASPIQTTLDTEALDGALGFNGNANGLVYQFSIPRAESISEAGMTLPPSMGTAIVINFQPTDKGKSAITGDFVLIGKEVDPVLKALRGNGIEVTALHSHMVDESPRLYFMHFWANDATNKLAKGLRTALDLINVKRS